MNLGDEDDAHARAHAADIRKRFAGHTVTTSQIVLFDPTDGLIPCPAAITVLLLCIQLKQLSLGFALVAVLRHWARDLDGLGRRRGRPQPAPHRAALERLQPLRASRALHLPCLDRACRSLHRLGGMARTDDLNVAAASIFSRILKPVVAAQRLTLHAWLHLQLGR